MAKKSNKQKQKQKQSLTNIIKIALDRKRSSGRKRPVRRTPTSQEQMAQMAQQQLLNQLLTSNQPVRTGPSILERTFQDERLRNIERELKAVNDLARRSFTDGSMSGKTAQELLTPPQTPKIEPPVGVPDLPILKPTKNKPIFEPSPTPSIAMMKKFLKENLKEVPKQKAGRKKKYTKRDIDGLEDEDLINQLYMDTFNRVIDDEPGGAAGGGGGEGVFM